MEQLDIFDLGVEYHYRPPLLFNRPVRLFEAFAGVGCQAMAFRRAKLPYVSVGISEIDKHAIKSYEAIHGETKNYGDIKLMREIPPCDVFTWSFPCTDLSKAGKRKGMTDDTRSGLVYEVLRLLKSTEEKPLCLIMENVPDLVQEMFKAQFYEIQKEIASYGYKNFTLTLNAKDFGVAQNRERVFMVSLLGDYHYEFPMPIKLEKRLKDYLEPNVAEKYYLSEKMIRYFNDNSKANEEKGNGFRFTPKRTDDIANALTLKTSDRMEGNFGVDPKCIQVGTLEGGKWEKMHDIARRFYDTSGIAPTIHTVGGGNLEPKIAEPICLNSKVNGKQPSLQDRIYSVDGTSTAITQSFMPSIAIPEATERGYAFAQEGDGVYINRPHQKRGCVQKGKIQALKTSGNDVGVVVDTYNKRILDNQNVVGTITSNTGTYGHCGNFSIINNLRIRKLTPRECWRLMGIDDSDFDKAQEVCSNSQLYKQAGNGIVVDVFAAILKNLIEYQPKGKE